VPELDGRIDLQVAGRRETYEMATPRYIKRLQAITRADPDRSHLERLERELYASESDRATAVLFGSFVETALEKLLLSLMRPNLNADERTKLFGFEGLFGTFSSKIIGGYALKVIGPVTYADLNLIKLLRNEFAHSRVPIGFDTLEVKDICDRLQIPDLPDSSPSFGYIGRGIDESKVDGKFTHARTRFMSACHNISYRVFVKRDGPQPGDFVFLKDEPLP
jgi:hypothetical protein